MYVHTYVYCFYAMSGKSVIYYRCRDISQKKERKYEILNVLNNTSEHFFANVFTLKMQNRKKKKKRKRQGEMQSVHVIYVGAFLMSGVMQAHVD